MNGGVVMANQKIIAKKAETVEEIANKVKNSASTVLFEYQGLTVTETMELRRKLRESGSDYKVYKNTLVKRAMDSLNIDFSDVWTKEELYNNWRVQNAWWYANSGPCPLTLSKNPLLARNLLKNILEEAQKAVEGKGDNASLRFGHDMGILPLASLMGMQGCDVKTTDLENLQTVWTDFRIIPMGANIQLIFYRHKKSKNVLVKALLNENEVTLPLKSDTAPYYNWEDFYQYYSALLKEIAIK